MLDADLTPENIDYVCAHGTGTKANDAMEVISIKTALGKRAYEIPVSSLKRLHGHALGGSSAIELIVSLLGARRGIVPGTLNLRTPAPKCDLDHVAGGPRPYRYQTFLNQSFGFGGQNAVLAIRATEVTP